MKGRKAFSSIEINKIKELLRVKATSNRNQQKYIRGQMRYIGFYISDFTNSKTGFSVNDLDELIRLGGIIITDSVSPPVLTST